MSETFTPDINHPFFFGTDPDVEYYAKIDSSWFDFEETAEQTENFVPIIPYPSSNMGKSYCSSSVSKNC